MKQRYESILFEKISPRAAFAYNRYWLHKYQAVIEYDRVQQCLHEKSLYGEWLQEPDTSQNDASRLWFHFGSIVNKKAIAEIHLYFISLDNIKDMINAIVSETDLVFIKREIRDLYKLLEHYTHGRNIFEHYSDRIPGGKFQDKVAEVIDEKSGNSRKILSGLNGEIYKFGNEEWSLSASKFQEIKIGLNNFEIILHNYLSNID
jgi:hypothetical protein